MTLRFIAPLLILSCLTLHAGREHDRNMERAHPTPIGEPNYDTLTYLIPMIQGVSVYPSMFTNASMVVDETGSLPAQNESSIAINPLNPRNLIGSAVDYRNNSSTWAYYSTDAGKSWTNVDLGKAREGWASSNDPSVCFDHEGRGFLCYGGFNRTGNTQSGENGVFVSMTMDGGITWSPKHTAVIIHTGQQTADSAFEDKYYIHADTSSTSPLRGNLYIPWKRVINRDSSTQIVITSSTDHGLTWRAPVAVGERYPHTSEDTTFGQSFPLARTGPDGSVHVVWNSGTEDGVRYARSTDGGATWSSTRLIQSYKPFGEKSKLGDQVNSRVKGVVRAEAYPTLTIDNTTGPRGGWLYLCWAADNYPNVYFSRSTDNGTTWSTSKVVHTDTTNDQFWPWISLDPTSGDLAVMYFDSRDDAANILVNCYVSYSSDGGTTWVDRRVGDDNNDLRRNPFAFNTFAGDYSGCDFRNGMVYPSWVDMRNTTEQNRTDNDVYTAIINVRAPEAPETFAAITLPDEPTSIDLEWSAVDTRSFGQPLDTTGARFVLRRDSVLIGEFPLNILSTKDLGLELYREYHYDLRVAAGSDTSSIRFASAFAGGSRAPGTPIIREAHGTTPGSIAVTLTIPTKRLDGVTPLANLKSISFLANTLTINREVLASDTGKTITFDVLPNSYGWYRITAVCVDSNNNQSPASNEAIAFTGDLQWTTEKFDSLPNYLTLNGEWGLSSFAYSQPNSLTETPSGPYGPSQRDTIIMYPYRAASVIPEANSIALTYRVAAFVDPNDTMFLEGKYGGIDLDGDWNVIEWWNAGKDDRWSDTTKGDDAWRFGRNILALSPDTLMLRLRFRTNVARHSDGFYIDDITMEPTTSVDEHKSVVRSVFPQPALTHAVIELATDELVSRCSLVDAHGSLTNATWYQSGRTLVFDLKHVSSGTYTARVECSGEIAHTRVTVLK